MAVEFKSKGSFSKTEKFLNKLVDKEYLNILDKYGKRGVEALMEATPVDTGKTRSSWRYDITQEDGKTKINFYNDNNVTNKTGYEFNVVILLEMGHATRGGGWVEGVEFVNPALKPIFDEILNAAWGEIQNM